MQPLFAIFARLRRMEGSALDESDVVFVGAEGARQDPHEVAVVAEILQEAGHAPARETQRTCET